MRDFKLTIDLLPKGAWGNDFSKTLSKKDWDLLRNKCYERANYECEICGYKSGDLDAHEVWDFDVESKTQTLIDIIALCSKCHGVKHFRNSERLGFGENAKKHFMKINNCTEIEFASHLAQARLEFEERNEVYRWKIKADLSEFGGDDIEYKQDYIPKIINPYTKRELEKLRNSCELTPRILNIKVNNYEGTISVECDKTNKIIWWGKDKLKTKFNFSNNFRTIFSVKELKEKEIYFELYGKYGNYMSKHFELTNFD